MSDEPLKKDATIEIKLKADSGYTSQEKTRIRVDQWQEICKILADNK